MLARNLHAPTVFLRPLFHDARSRDAAKRFSRKTEHAEAKVREGISQLKRESVFAESGRDGPNTGGD